MLKNKDNELIYFYNLLDDTPVTINDVHNWYEINSKDSESYESEYNTFEEYFDSLFGLNADLISISKEEYNGLLNGTHEFDSFNKFVFEKDIEIENSKGGM